MEREIVEVTHTADIGTTFSLIGVAIVANRPVVAPVAVRHFLRSDRSAPAPLLSDL